MKRGRRLWWRRTAALGTLCALSALLVGPAGATAASPGARTSIIGGDVATIEAFPSLTYIAAETGKNEGFACTGTVISPRVILTAAHCVEDLTVGGFTPPREYTVVTGRGNPRDDDGGNVLTVGATHVFPRFDPGPAHGDAALLVLSSPTSAPPIALAGAADGSLYAGGAEVLLAGWGLTRADA